jgi:hypothetical protein
MVGEVLAGSSALKTAFDIAKGLKDINDATLRNAAVIELQEKIIFAQAEQSALVERISDLEAEMVRFAASVIQLIIERLQPGVDATAIGRDLHKSRA